VNPPSPRHLRRMCICFIFTSTKSVSLSLQWANESSRGSSDKLGVGCDAREVVENSFGAEPSNSLSRSGGHDVSGDRNSRKQTLSLWQLFLDTFLMSSVNSSSAVRPTRSSRVLLSTGLRRSHAGELVLLGVSDNGIGDVSPKAFSWPCHSPPPPPMHRRLACASELRDAREPGACRVPSVSCALGDIRAKSPRGFTVIVDHESSQNAAQMCL